MVEGWMTAESLPYTDVVLSGAAVQPWNVLIADTIVAEV